MRRFALSVGWGAVVVAAVGAAARVSGARAGCVDWPLCNGSVWPDAGLAQFAVVHRTLAFAQGLATLACAAVVAWQADRRRWLGIAGCVLVLLQASALSRSGVLVSVAKREGLPFGSTPGLWAIFALACAALVLGIAATSRRPVGLWLLACELIETMSSLGALLALHPELGHWAAPLHGSVFQLYLTVLGLATLGARLSRPAAAALALGVLSPWLLPHEGWRWLVPALVGLLAILPMSRRDLTLGMASAGALTLATLVPGSAALAALAHGARSRWLLERAYGRPS